MSSWKVHLVGLFSSVATGCSFKTVQDEIYPEKKRKREFVVQVGKKNMQLYIFLLVLLNSAHAHACVATSWRAAVSPKQTKVSRTTKASGASRLLCDAVIYKLVVTASFCQHETLPAGPASKEANWFRSTFRHPGKSEVEGRWRHLRLGSQLLPSMKTRIEKIFSVTVRSPSALSPHLQDLQVPPLCDSSARIHHFGGTGAPGGAGPDHPSQCRRNN